MHTNKPKYEIDIFPLKLLKIYTAGNETVNVKLNQSPLTFNYAAPAFRYRKLTPNPCDSLDELYDLTSYHRDSFGKSFDSTSNRRDPFLVQRNVRLHHYDFRLNWNKSNSNLGDFV